MLIVRPIHARVPMGYQPWVRAALRTMARSVEAATQAGLYAVMLARPTCVLVRAVLLQPEHNAPRITLRFVQVAMWRRNRRCPAGLVGRSMGVLARPTMSVRAHMGIGHWENNAIAS
jgi:hypothetical protein